MMSTQPLTDLNLGAFVGAAGAVSQQAVRGGVDISIEAKGDGATRS